MKILFLVFNITGKGTYWRAFHLGRHLARRGHQVTLVSTSKNERWKIKSQVTENLTLVEMPDLFCSSLRSGWDPWNALRRISWLRSRKFDLVHAFESRPTVIFPALFISKRLKIPLFIDWADWFGKGGSVEERENAFLRAALRPVETFFEEHFRPFADGHTVICTTLQQKVIQIGIPDSKILLLQNGANIEQFQSLPIHLSRKNLDLSEQSFILGYVGAIFQKDAQLMASAFNILIDTIPQALLIIAGYCPYDIKKLLRQEKSVLQTGSINTETLNQYLSACDILWLPLCNTNANQGRLPLKLTDYLAIGRAIIATNIGDIPTVITHNQNGLLSSDNPETLAAQVIELFHDPERRKRMGEKARQLAETSFLWASQAERLENFYQWRKIETN